MDGVSFKGSHNLAVQNHAWGAGSFVHYFDVLPTENPAPTRLHCFADGLLGSEPCCKMLFRILFGSTIADFRFCEDSLDKGITLLFED